MPRAIQSRCGSAMNPSLSAARYTGFGFEFAAMIVAGVLLGYYVDRLLGSEPLLTLGLTLGAFVGAVRRLIWNLNRASKAQKNEHSPD